MDTPPLDDWPRVAYPCSVCGEPVFFPVAGTPPLTSQVVATHTDCVAAEAVAEAERILGDGE